MQRWENRKLKCRPVTENLLCIKNNIIFIELTWGFNLTDVNYVFNILDTRHVNEILYTWNSPNSRSCAIYNTKVSCSNYLPHRYLYFRDDTATRSAPPPSGHCWRCRCCKAGGAMGCKAWCTSGPAAAGGVGFPETITVVCCCCSTDLW